MIDRFVISEVFLARLKLAQGDAAGAAAILAKADQSARQQNFVYRIPEVAAAQVLTLLRQGNLGAAAHLAQTYELPISQARVHLAQGDATAALAVLHDRAFEVRGSGHSFSGGSGSSSSSPSSSSSDSSSASSSDSSAVSSAAQPAVPKVVFAPLACFER